MSRNFAALLQPDIGWRSDATRALAVLVRDELDHAPGLELDAAVTHADPATGLLRAAEDASLIVVGSRGRGGATSVLLGSVSSKVVAASDRPVVVVPPAYASTADRVGEMTPEAVGNR